MDLAQNIELGSTGTSTNRRSAELCQGIQNTLRATAAGGLTRCARTVWTVPNDSNARRAYMLGVMSGGSGTLSSALNGTSFNRSWATSDAATISAHVAAINASTAAKIQNISVASNYYGTITCASVAAGDTINVLGYTFTACNGTPDRADKFDCSVDDNNTANNLAIAITAHHILGTVLGAHAWYYESPINAGGPCNKTAVVKLILFDSVFPAGATQTIYGASTFTISQLANGAATMAVSCVFPGAQGNTSTFSFAGTGCVMRCPTFVDLGLGGIPVNRLTGGTGGNSNITKDVFK